jgi:hypothetical protein
MPPVQGIATHGQCIHSECVTVAEDAISLILSSQWPDKVGKGLMFISLDVGVLDALRAELEGRGVDVLDGQWATGSGHRGPGRQPALLPLSDVSCHWLS